MTNKNIIISLIAAGFLVAVIAVLAGGGDDNASKNNEVNVVEEVKVEEVIIQQNDQVVATTTLEAVVSNETEVAPAPKPATKPVVTETKPVVVEDPAPTPTPTPTPVPEPVKPSGITMAEVRTHADASSCWSTINGAVYDLTTYIPKHPGGKGEILAICGKDGSSAFDGQHGGDAKPERILASYKIGDLSN